MMSALVDMTGQRYGRLKVICRAAPRKSKSGKAKHVFWRCECKCGETVEVDGASLRRGHVKSCGCWRSEIISMRRTKKYYPYKGKNLTAPELCKETGISRSTLFAREKAGVTGSALTSTGRIRIATEWRGRPVMKAEYDGEILTLRELSIRTGISEVTLRNRYRAGLRGKMLWKETEREKDG